MRRRAALAQNSERITRQSRALVFTSMPDLTNDENALAEFQRSFFEDVAARAGDRRPARVVKSIIEGVRQPPSDLLDPEGWLKAFAVRLGNASWTDDDWVRQRALSE
jgi:hypothetical protein